MSAGRAAPVSDVSESQDGDVSESQDGGCDTNFFRRIILLLCTFPGSEFHFAV